MFFTNYNQSLITENFPEPKVMCRKKTPIYEKYMLQYDRLTKINIVIKLVLIKIVFLFIRLTSSIVFGIESTDVFKLCKLIALNLHKITYFTSFLK